MNILLSFMLATIIFLTTAFSYNIWLDSGCQLEGIMTWHGKECMVMPPTQSCDNYQLKNNLCQ